MMVANILLPMELRAQRSGFGEVIAFMSWSIVPTLVHLESHNEMNHGRRAVVHIAGARWSEMAPGHLVLYHPSFMSSSARRSSAADLAEHRGVQVSPDVRREEA
jgi:hypothetical protein